MAIDNPPTSPLRWMLLVGGISLLVGSGLHVVDDAQLDRELLVATMGLALVLVAFTTGWRHRLIYGHHARMVLLGLLLGVWGAGEALARGLFGGALLVGVWVPLRVGAYRG